VLYYPCANSGAFVSPKFVRPLSVGEPSDLRYTCLWLAGRQTRKMTGIVKWFNDAKGYGFIETEGGGPDVFVHFSALPELGGHRTLNDGQRVEFEVTQERGRDRAANVVLL
jgi:CspA family cold shock protein